MQCCVPVQTLNCTCLCAQYSAEHFEFRGFWCKTCLMCVSLLLQYTVCIQLQEALCIRGLCDSGVCLPSDVRFHHTNTAPLTVVCPICTMQATWASIACVLGRFLRSGTVSFTSRGDATCSIFFDHHNLWCMSCKPAVKVAR